MSLKQNKIKTIFLIYNLLVQYYNLFTLMSQPNFNATDKQSFCHQKIIIMKLSHLTLVMNLNF